MTITIYSFDFLGVGAPTGGRAMEEISPLSASSSKALYTADLCPFLRRGPPSPYTCASEPQHAL